MSSVASGPSCGVPLNIFEKRELWLEEGSEATCNFTFIASYIGKIEGPILKESLLELAKHHLHLRSAIKIVGLNPIFVELSELKLDFEESEDCDDKWIKVANDYKQKRFTKGDNLLWRVHFLEGEDKGHIVFTFQHSIADGVSAAEIINQLFKIVSAKMLGIECDIQFNQTPPDIQSLFKDIGSLKPSSPPAEEAAKPVKVIRTNFSHQTGFIPKVIDEAATTKLVAWSKAKGVTVHCALFAAFAKAVWTVEGYFDEYFLCSVVNFRSYFTPPVAKEFAALLSGAVGNLFKNRDLGDLAKAIHEDLHTQLKEGKHIVGLSETAERLERQKTPAEFLQGSQVPPNSIAISNIGKMTFDGIYGNGLEMTGLCFFGNVHTIIQHPEHNNLHLLTFRNKIHFMLEYIDGSEDGIRIRKQKIAEEFVRIVTEEIN